MLDSDGATCLPATLCIERQRESGVTAKRGRRRRLAGCSTRAATRRPINDIEIDV
jgi:hypothetical protein